MARGRQWFKAPLCVTLRVKPALRAGLVFLPRVPAGLPVAVPLLAMQHASPLQWAYVVPHYNVIRLEKVPFPVAIIGAQDGSGGKPGSSRGRDVGCMRPC